MDATNWNAAQIVTVTGLNDYSTTPSQTYQISGSASSTDTNYNGMAMTPVTVTNIATGITIAGNSFLVVEDNNIVRVNSLTGAVIATYPTGVANDGLASGPDGSLYVADYYNNQILQFNATGTFVTSFGAGQLNSPQGLAFGPDQNLYVTDLNNSVQTFSPNGTFLGTFISAGSGGLANAKNIVWGPDGNAYVSSYSNSEVIRYNGTTGAFMNVFATGGGGFEDIAFGPDNNLYVAGYGNSAVYRYSGTNGALLGTFVSGIATPYGLRFDPAGNLDVSSRSTGQIEVYDGTTGALRGTLVAGLTNPAYIATTTSLVTSETGTSANFSVVLNNQPTADVTITFSSTMPTQGTMSPSTLTFTTANWNVAQSITITGLDDQLVNGDQTYQINGSVASADANYDGMVINPVIVVNQEADSATTTTVTSSNNPRVYGQAVTFTATVSAVGPGMPTGTVTFYDGAANLATVALSGGTANYTTSTFLAGNHGISADYNGATFFVTSVSSTLSQNITPATLTVTADDVSKVYGQANPSFTDTIAGYVNGDNASVVSGSPSLTSTATAASGVGTYTITAAQGSLSAANYTFAFSNGTLTVTPATLTVTADDVSKVYGQANPSFTDTIAGYVNGDNASVVSGSPSLTSTATAASGVGTYTITAAQGSLSAANYTIAFSNGTLTVTPALLTVTADDVSKVYGQANPSFTDIIAGYVNGDNASVVSGSPSLTSTANASSGVGTYTITAAQGSLSAANYTFVFTNGTLTVTPGATPTPLPVTSPNAISLPSSLGASVSSSAQPSASEGKSSSTNTSGPSIGVVSQAPSAHNSDIPTSQNSDAGAIQSTTAGADNRKMSFQWIVGPQSPAKTEQERDSNQVFVPPPPPPVDFDLSSVTAGTTGSQGGRPDELTGAFLRSMLDDMDGSSQAQEADEPMGVFVSTGLIASAGYVLLNTRTGFWLLSLMASRPLWKQFDPLEILYAWEEENTEKTETREETLLSLVD